MIIKTFIGKDKEFLIDTLGFQMLPVECGLSNHFNAKGVTTTFWAYLPKHPMEVN